MKTFYAPPERIEPKQLLSQVQAINDSQVMATLLQAASGLLMVINANRQIVAINRAFTDAHGIGDPEKALGLRFGEILHCKYAAAERGCGTSRYCASCGAVIAMMAAIDDDQSCERICALTIDRKGQAQDLCLKVRSQPVVADGRRWILVHVQDISEHQNWANMENDFLHDLDNMLCLVKNYSSYLLDQAPADEALQKLRITTERAYREVRLRNKLSHQRQLDSIATIERISLLGIRKMVFNVVLYRSVMTGRNIIEEGPIDDLYLSTDPVLVSRVIINMLLNALEATGPDGTVTLRTIVQETAITWQVWNEGHIPEGVQLRIFQKYFSTRTDVGRGHGTYLMKLLGETCLGGTVAFVSTPTEGTTFSFILPVR